MWFQWQVVADGQLVKCSFPWRHYWTFWVKVSSFPSLKQSTLSLERIEGDLPLRATVWKSWLRALHNSWQFWELSLKIPILLDFSKLGSVEMLSPKSFRNVSRLHAARGQSKTDWTSENAIKRKKVAICRLPDAFNLRTPSSENLAKDFEPQISPNGDFTELPLQNLVTIPSFVQRSRWTRTPQNLTSQQACFRSITSAGKLFSKFAKEADDKQCENVNWVLFNRFKNCGFFLTMPRLVGGLHAPSVLTCRFAVEELALEHRNFISWVMQAWRM